ncbi:hypothetical protein G4B88_024907 [Cannabis sativa]|uniref:Uncharacterized protein n=1 Tax=Cannabis sativa TaxID=3483 RepID=A0A7J6GBF6_CANSA|nr:hypothetical protein G4B88_024907 [Cannabis sativa]
MVAAGCSSPTTSSGRVEKEEEEGIENDGTGWCWLLMLYQLLMFDSLNGRTCLHYVAYYGHSDCLQALLSSAHSSPVSISWLEKKVSPNAARGRRRTSNRHHCLSPRL